MPSVSPLSALRCLAATSVIALAVPTHGFAQDTMRYSLTTDVHAVDIPDIGPFTDVTPGLSTTIVIDMLDLPLEDDELYGAAVNASLTIGEQNHEFMIVASQAIVNNRDTYFQLLVVGTEMTLRMKVSGESGSFTPAGRLPREIDLDPSIANLVDAGVTGPSGESALIFSAANPDKFSIEVIPDPVDTDGDGLADYYEINVYDTDPNLADTDGDGLEDGEEVDDHGTDPLVADTDMDTVNDGDEIQCGTDPLVFDDFEPPSADAGADQDVPVGATVVLDGSESGDDVCDPSELSFHWSFVSTPGDGATLENADTATPSFVTGAVGTYEVQLVVTDLSGNASEPDIVVVSTANTPPVADAGLDVTVIVNETVMLDGLGSSDVDEDALTYSWSLVPPDPSSTAVLSDPHSAQPTLTPDIPGEYTLELVVNDGIVDSEVAEVVVTAISAGDFAADKVRESMDAIRLLPKSAFDRRGHKRALLCQLRGVLRDLNKDRSFHAAFKLKWWILPRLDGIALRGTVDPKGRWWQFWRTQRADWIVDETAQQEVYDCLQEALDALCP